MIVVCNVVFLAYYCINAHSKPNMTYFAMNTHTDTIQSQGRSHLGN